MERIKDVTVAQATVATKANSTLNVDFVMPPEFNSFSVEIVPKNTAATPSAMTAELLYWVVDAFYPTTPAATTGVPVSNKVLTFTKTDNVTGIRVTIGFGATTPDGDLLVRLAGSRQLQ